jgi:predicted lactoylglutathione lyase
MESKLISENLVSNDLEKPNKFSKESGFIQNGIYEAEKATSFFFGQKNFVINFY